MFYFLNHLRGTFSIYAKVNAVVLGVIFGLVTSNIYVGLAVIVGYIAGESMGWGEWIGGIIRNDGKPSGRPAGRSNGIEWLATRVTTLNSYKYHIVALGIRGFYWWFLTLMSLFLFINPLIVILSIILLSIGFPISVVITKHWKKAEYLYGLFQDLILTSLLLYHIYM
tara:strand:- start:2730 stop:3233 length:504 start_codon:yes stop_codon:yes gene_type:complete